MTRRHNSDGPLASVPSDPVGVPEGPAVEETLEGRSSRGESWRSFSSLLTWLITSSPPSVVVEVGSRDVTSLRSAADALAGTNSRYVVVPMPGRTHAGLLGDVADEDVHGLERHDKESDALSALAGGPAVDLLHVALLDDDTADLELGTWFDVMAPGSTVVFTTSGGAESTGFKQAEKAVSTDRFHTVQVMLGDDAHALVAQMPRHGRAVVVEALDGGAAGSPVASVASVETGVASALNERRQAERAAFLAALRMYEQLTTHLTEDLTAARSDLAAQREGARLEREASTKAFDDRLDVLSAKISTSAAKYSAELAEKDRTIEDVEKKMLAYAGLAADAQSVIDDIHRSSSWRVTAPVRLLSRLMGRAAAGRPEA